jgi:cytochrome c-type biogenesis protein CcmH
MKLLGALASSALLALAIVTIAAGGEQHPTLGELEGEVVCPTCHTTIDQSDSPIARRMKLYISARIRAGDTKSEIEGKLIAQFGPEVIAKPSTHGFDLVAWLLPLGALGAGAAALGIATWRWRRATGGSAEAPQEPLEPGLERRVDEELARFEG